MAGPIAVIVNPNSRKNRRGGVRVDELEAAVGSSGEVFVTRSLSELEQTIDHVLGMDPSCLVSVGGDGALHWALNAARPRCASRGQTLPPMLPTNGGTIDFVARKAGVQGNAMVLLPRLRALLDRTDKLPTVELDSLALEAESDAGQRSLLGFAVAAAGIGQRFFDKYYQDEDPGPLTIVGVIAKAVTSLSVGGQYAKDVFKPFEAKVTIDGVELPVGSHGGIHAGAFDVNLGGVIKVFPLAKERGTVQFQAGAISAPQIVAALPALLRGRPITTSPDLRDTAGHVMEIEATGEELLRPVVDGEIYEGIRKLRLSPGPRIRVARV
jgi:diacylglycerol kinase family enzyme